MTFDNNTPVLNCRAIRKEFGTTLALNNVDVKINPGEIVGLIGENGAGKSTLLKIIMGFQSQTSGEMTVKGKPYKPKRTTHASEIGIGMVYQEQSLLTNLTVAQNIFFGREDRFMVARVALNWKRMNEEAQKALDAIGNSSIRPEKLVLDYNFSLRQQIEIAKVLSTLRDSGVDQGLIMFDEPTSLLSDAEVNALFEQIRKLKDQGHSVIFVSHRLDEVLKIADRIYVFKDGSVVGDLDNKRLDEGMLYRLMVGKDSSGEFYRINEQMQPREEELLRVQNLGLRGLFKDVSFTLNRGEIVSICGVIGSGKEDVCRVICGDIPGTSGTMAIRGVAKSFSSPYKARKNDVICVPKERQIEGMVGIMSVEDNIALSSLERLSGGKLLKQSAIRALYNEWKNRLSIKCARPTEYMKSLSGGNAQKVVFSRVIASGADIVILNHPTRGVDVGAKEEIYALIRQLSAQGKGILMLCDTLEESIGLSHRILVMKDGIITSTLDAQRDNKPSKLRIIENMM